ncbi:Uncharacterized protein PECH_006745 [Penicillium ucsense]|uniref:Yeast cell wall synthesis Kre9/Knh1-like N-terminal domain-containing protein n=1 Tax=Penicillium ucsense TaxID=2839758 RepID=A0A8J8VZX8_9EURO|nr:Uncharacterized protein PECM_000448 [Penicillium ucsense]KAF7735333.1 Uncharacterized protein PECH_006745 [Penicillium ucsense]
MRAFTTLAAVLFAAIAYADDKANAFKNPTGGYQFTAGQPTTLNWKADAGTTVTLRLQYGAVTTADSGKVIAANIPNSGSYTWSVPADIVAQPDYTIEIIDDQDPSKYNFLPRFVVSGASTTPSSSSSASTMTSTTTVSTTSTATNTSTMTSGSASATPSTMTTASSSAMSSSSASSSATGTSTSSTSSTSASTSVPTSNAGVANRVSGGLLAVVAGAAMMV